jgi:diguanylate cyclase (GGDEF)-like protein
MPDFKEKEGSFHYSTIDGVSKIAYYHRIDELGWILITVVNKNEILLPIIFKIILMLSVVLSAAVILGIITSNTLIKNVVAPLVELESYLIDSTKKEKEIQYPDNEIGRLARAIQSITDAELYKKNQQLMDMNAQLEVLSITDPLTGLYNRRKILQEIEDEKLRAERYVCNVSILIFDIDHFKNINDMYGHGEGDLILKELGELIRSSIRATDVFARWGGEEFMLLLPETDLTSAVAIAEKLRVAVERHIFSNGKNITISIGVSTFIKGCSVDDFIREADDMLYRAKETGRNKVQYIKKRESS